MSQRQLLADIADVVRRHPHSSAIETDDGAHSYEQVWRDSANAAAWLKRNGVETVALDCSNIPDAIIGLLAALRAGSDLSFVDHHWPPGRTAIVAASVPFDAVLHSGPVPSPALRHLPSHALTTTPAALEIDEFDGTVESGYVVFTSGSTAAPKGIRGRIDGVGHFVRWQRERFGVRPTDRFACLTAVSFDVFLRDALTPLVAGATLVVPPADWRESGLDVLAWLDKRNITCLHAVPALAGSWLTRTSADATVSTVRMTFFAGEPLRQPLVRRWQELMPNTRVVNFYGPSETTLAAFFHEVGPSSWDQSSAPVGTPIPGVAFALLDADGTPVAPGAAGQVAISSPHRSYGYLDPALTNEKFLQRPDLALGEDTTVYLTGDLGKIDTEGRLIVLGRLDDEVKINGIRIDPIGVAHAVTQAVDFVVECHVLKTPEESGAQLVAFYRGDPSGASPRRMRDLLSPLLVPAQIPSRFIHVDTIPMTVSGKVDRSRLLDLAATRQPAATRPVDDDLLAHVLTAWRSALPDREIGPESDFYEVGGDSLTAAEIGVRLHDVLGAPIPHHLIAQHPTPIELRDALLQPGNVGFSTSSRVTRTAPDQANEAGAEFSLSPTQRWYAKVYGGPASRTAVVSFVYEAPTPMPREEALDVLRTLGRRHEALRTVFSHRRGSLLQRTLTGGEYAALLSDLVIQAPSDDVDAVRRRAISRGVELVNPRPPWRAHLVPGATGGVQSLVVVLHHLICDGGSLPTLSRELNLMTKGQTLPNLHVPSLREVVHIHRQREVQNEFADHGAYWNGLLDGYSSPMHLPLREAADGASVSHRLAVAPETCSRVRDAARAARSTPFTFFAAASALLYSQMYERADVVVGCPVSGREAPLRPGTVGMHTRMTCLRVRTDGVSIAQLVQTVHQGLLRAQQHSAWGFDRIIEAAHPAPGRFPLTGALIGALPGGAGGHTAPDAVESTVTGRQVLFDVHTFLEEDTHQMVISLQHRPDAITPTTARHLLKQLAQLLEEVAEGVARSDGLSR